MRPFVEDFVDGALLTLKLGIIAGLAAWAAVEVFHVIEHLPTAMAWVGICFAVIGCSIGALIARHENNLDNG